MCSIRVLAKKNLGDPYYEPTIVVHDKQFTGVLSFFFQQNTHAELASTLCYNILAMQHTDGELQVLV